MPTSKLNIAEMIYHIRQLSGASDTSRVVDGIVKDGGEDMAWSDPDKFRILSAINRKVREIADLGIFRCEYSIRLQEDVREYIIPSGAHELKSIWLRRESDSREYSVRLCSIEDLDCSQNGWRNARAPRPEACYFNGSYVLGTYPMPSTDEYFVCFIATSIPQDVDKYTDYITQVVNSDGAVLVDTDVLPVTMLPSAYHLGVCYGAAMEVCLFLGDTAKYEYNAGIWEKCKDRLAGVVNNRHTSEIVDLTPGRNGWGRGVYK